MRSRTLSIELNILGYRIKVSTRMNSRPCYQSGPRNMTEKFPGDRITLAKLGVPPIVIWVLYTNAEQQVQTLHIRETSDSRIAGYIIPPK